ncbi:transcriptional regulator, SARP family [Alloactinosynnema sp. L-07]|nr:transcriptional regulator, SARP family [Alloactinosynnema sp. L-07]
MTTTAMPPDEPEEPFVVGGSDQGQVVQVGSIIGGVHVHSSATPVPRQLPTSPSSFVGRQEELARLVAGVDKTEAPITLISGMPGVGKTALAVHWAHRVADRFPDGQLFVDMHGYDTAGVPLSPDDALGFLLHALGVAPDAVPVDLDARAAVFRSLSSSRRLLIVLDNVAADEQVLPLLPGTGPSALVVTSRKRMNLLTATLSVTTIVLDPLPLDSSMALFIHVVGEERVQGEPDAATALVALCAGLPLALRIVGALVQARPHTPLAELRNSFAHRSDRLLSEGADDGQTSLTAVLSWSYAALPRDAARLLRLLGLHENEIVTEAEAAALGDLSPSDAASLLNQLRAQNMLDAYDQGYVLHPLVHSYARQLVFREEGEEERAAAERRLSAVTGQPRQNVDWVNDAPATTDRLNRGVLADVLALRLRQAQREQPDISFLVHLDGPWGAGKTTLLNLLAHRLADPPDSSLVVTFDAWRHAKVDPPWWALITCLRDQLIRAAPWWRRPATRAREITARVTRSGASYLLALVILVLLVVGVVAMLGPISLTPTKFGELAKALAAALTVVAGFWTAGKVATKLLLWDSPAVRACLSRRTPTRCGTSRRTSRGSWSTHRGPWSSSSTTSTDATRSSSSASSTLSRTWCAMPRATLDGRGGLPRSWWPPTGRG